MTEGAAQSTPPVLRAALWMSGTIVAFTVMAVAGREVSDRLDTFEIMLYRSVVGLLIVALIITGLRKWPDVSVKRIPDHILRNITHFTGQNLWFYAVTVIPLAQVFALEFTSPIWALLLAPLILGERLTWARAGAALAGFAGVLIVTRPGMMGVNAGVITAALSAVFFALTNLLTRRLTRTETITCIMFYLTLIQLILGLIAAGYDGDIAPPDGSTWGWLVLIGLAGLLAHFCLTNALALAPAIVIMPIDFIRLPTIAIIGMLVYGELLDPWVFVGAAVIFLGNYANLWMETRPSRDVTKK